MLTKLMSNKQKEYLILICQRLHKICTFHFKRVYAKFSNLKNIPRNIFVSIYVFIQSFGQKLRWYISMYVKNEYEVSLGEQVINFLPSQFLFVFF